MLFTLLMLFMLLYILLPIHEAAIMLFTLLMLFMLFYTLLHELSCYYAIYAINAIYAIIHFVTYT